MTTYAGKDLSSYSLQELKDILNTLQAAEVRRVEASQHPKFNVDREVDGKTIKKLEFPPPNPAFIELKNEIIKLVGNENLLVGNN